MNVNYEATKVIKELAGKKLIIFGEGKHPKYEIKKESLKQ